MEKILFMATEVDDDDKEIDDDSSDMEVEVEVEVDEGDADNVGAVMEAEECDVGSEKLQGSEEEEVLREDDDACVVGSMSSVNVCLVSRNDNNRKKCTLLVPRATAITSNKRFTIGEQNSNECVIHISPFL
jgi:hypothetical protein